MGFRLTQSQVAQTVGASAYFKIARASPAGNRQGARPAGRSGPWCLARRWCPTCCSTDATARTDPRPSPGEGVHRSQHRCHSTRGPAVASERLFATQRGKEHTVLLKIPVAPQRARAPSSLRAFLLLRFPLRAGGRRPRVTWDSHSQVAK